ncbi:hypothetical protein EJB05_12267 [Eragrostis curvula]|uniref:RRM domain-containing protein n=1 Tax=Eragrostis curvula TaxID=38414 RepID=A0A5J9VR59_9POAL|nr:hypothetical protein EJB05_12267 [Eragrostis curvula]
MEYISPERHLEGSCGDPGPLFGDHDGSLLDHLDYEGGGFQGGVSHHESPALDEGLLVDPADTIPYLPSDLPFMNDQITCNSMKSASASPEPLLKQAQEPLNTGSDMQNDAAEQNVHNNSEAEVTPVGCDDVHKSPEVIGAVLPRELPESSANDTSNFQQEATHSDAYLGDSLLTENNSHQLNNSGDDEDEMPNSLVLRMENDDIKKTHETSYSGKNGSEDGYINGRKSSPIDSHDKENFNTSGARSSWEQPEQENPGTRNGSSIPDNRYDFPPERFERLERDTPSPDGRGSPERFERLERDTPSPDGRGSPERFQRLERDTPSADGRLSPRVKSPRAPHSDKMESQHPAKDDDLAHSESPPARHQSRSPQRHDTNRKRASPRESSPHAQNNSPIEKRRRRESRHDDGSPRRRSVSPRRRSTPPRRRSTSPRRSSHKRRSSPRRDSPRRRDSRRESPRRKESPRRRDSSRRKDSPRRRDRSKSRSPSRRTDSSRHRREHDRSRSRSPHSRDHHRRSPRRHSPRRRSSPSSHRHHSPKRHWSPPANRKTGLGKPGRNLFVAGFSYATTERDLEKKFAKYGRVTSARVVRDKRTGDSRGFGFLTLEKDEDADAAIRACDETEWNGRIILVEKSKAPTW